MKYWLRRGKKSSKKKSKGWRQACGERRRKLEGKKGERNIDGNASSTQKVLGELKRSQIWSCLQASALPENKKRKQELLLFFNVDISHFCTQIVLTLLPDHASLAWPFGVPRLGSPDLCICLFSAVQPEEMPV